MKFIHKVYFLLIGFTTPILSMFAIFIAYIVLGSLIFAHLETASDAESHLNATNNRAKEMVNVIRNNFSDSEIFHAFLAAHEEQKDRPKPESLAWDQLFVDKVFFAFNLVTTVGFGKVAFKSNLSQTISVIYIMFGLPIQVILMRLLSFQFRGCLRKALVASQAICPRYKWILFIVGFIFFFVWTSIFIFIPAYIVALRQDWRYNRGVYYSFVSLTTVGVDDFIGGLPEHMGHFVYPCVAFLVLLCIVFGLGFVYMAFNMFSYVLGVYTLDKLDCKCKRRADAKRKLKLLLVLVTDLNWQLVKSIPHGFHDWMEIEDFKMFIIETPQDVTPEMLKRMYDIAMKLKVASFEQLSKMQLTVTPLTPIIERAKDDLPYILRRYSTRVSYSAKIQGSSSLDSTHPNIETKSKRGEANSNLNDLLEEKNDKEENNQCKDILPSTTLSKDSEYIHLRAESETSHRTLVKTMLKMARRESNPKMNESVTGKTADDDDEKVDK